MYDVKFATRGEIMLHKIYTHKYVNEQASAHGMSSEKEFFFFLLGPARHLWPAWSRSIKMDKILFVDLKQNKNVFFDI